MKLLISALFFSFAQNAWAALPQKITLATTDWCPYACDVEIKGPGFIVEFMKDILKRRGVDLVVHSYPWTRAIEFAKTGKVDGLLTAAASEMEGLSHTKTPTGTYNVCFYTKSKNPWTYSGLASLKGVSFGIIADYSYGEPVDGFIKDKANAGQFTVKHANDGLVILLLMLRQDRFVATLDDQNVVENVASEHHIPMADFKKSGCLGDNPFYTAFNPKLPWANEVIKILNEDLKKPEIKALYQKYLDKYTK